MSVLLVALFIVCIPVLSSAQSSPSTWTDTSKNPTLKIANSIDKAEYDNLLDNRQGYHHQECIEKKIAIRKLPIKYYAGCWYMTEIGLLEEDGRYLLQPGQQIAGYIKGNTRDTSTLKPSANPNVFLELVADEATGYGSFVTLRDRTALEFNEDVYLPTGSLTLTYKNPGKRLKWDSGSIHVQDSHVWYSSNAEWMVLWHDNNPYAVRVNMSTFDATAVYVRSKPSGLRLKGHASISDDGRYIAISLTDTSLSELYIEDLDSCTSMGPYTNLETVKCKNRTLKSYLKNTITNYTAAFVPRFYSNDTLGFYHPNTSASYTLYTLQAPDTTATASDYLAMGDSFASGEGAFGYEDGTDDEVNKCHLSKKSYPYLMNQQLALSSFRSIACSGAKIENIIAGSEENNQSKKGDDYDEFHPGFLRQIAHVKKQKPSIITISISGNDIAFADKLKYCVLEATDCFDTYEDRLEIIREINNKFDKLTDTYRQIKQNAAPDAKIYALGYPQIVDERSEASCGANVHLSAEERDFAFNLIAYFNKAIKGAATKLGVLYTGVEGSLMGNRLCETSSAAVAVNGVTAGNDEGILGIKFIGKESFHPNEKGHVLMKNAILERTENFTKPMPAPDSGATVPAEQDQTSLLNAPRSNRSINTKNYDEDPGNNVIYGGKPLQTTIKAITYGLIGMAAYRVILNSTPTDLGTATSDINGDLDINLPVPEDVEPGMHTLHIYGKNEQGEDIDIYRYVYVAVSESDANGNGTPDDQEACIWVQPSGTDVDEDGTDDACDEIIGGNPGQGPENPDNPEEDNIQALEAATITPTLHPAALLPKSGGTLYPAAASAAQTAVQPKLNTRAPSAPYWADAIGPSAQPSVLRRNLSRSKVLAQKPAKNIVRKIPSKDTMIATIGCLVFVVISGLVYVKKKGS